MDYVDTIVEELDKIAIGEIMQYAVPTLDDYNDTVNMALWIGRQMNANLDVIKLGARFMKLKLGEATNKKKKAEYVNMCLGFAMEFLTGYPISEDFKKKVFACIKEQNDGKFSCVEAEICTNAECCNYLTPRKIFKRFYNLHDRGYSFEEAFLLVDEHVEEKWNKLTLDITKKNWENNHKIIREFIELARRNPEEFIAVLDANKDLA